MYHTSHSSVHILLSSLLFFFFNDSPTTEIYTLSLHDALPIFVAARTSNAAPRPLTQSSRSRRVACADRGSSRRRRSEEHTSELQSHSDLVCRLLLEKKKTTPNYPLIFADRLDLEKVMHYHRPA